MAEIEKVPGRAERMDKREGVTSAARRMKCFVLKEAEEKGECSLEVGSVMNGEQKADCRLPLALSPNRGEKQHLTKLKRNKFRARERKCSPHNV